MAKPSVPKRLTQKVKETREITVSAQFQIENFEVKSKPRPAPKQARNFAAGVKGLRALKSTRPMTVGNINPDPLSRTFSEKMRLPTRQRDPLAAAQ